MLVFFDTETTGLPDGKLPPGHARQPHVVQLAAILTEDDGTERASLSMIVNPMVPIPAEVAKIHGINDDIAERCGVHPKVAAVAFRGMMNRAWKMVAHNIGFDVQLMHTMFARQKMEFEFPGARSCTMEMSTPILSLEPTEAMKKSGRTGPKPPKLGEAYKHFFGKELEGAHDALVDVRACRDIYFAIVNGDAKA